MHAQDGEHECTDGWGVGASMEDGRRGTEASKHRFTSAALQRRMHACMCRAPTHPGVREEQRGVEAAGVHEAQRPQVVLQRVTHLRGASSGRSQGCTAKQVWQQQPPGMPGAGALPAPLQTQNTAGWAERVPAVRTSRV